MTAVVPTEPSQREADLAVVWCWWLARYTRYAPGTAAPRPEAFRGMLRAGKNPMASIDYSPTRPVELTS